MAEVTKGDQRLDEALRDYNIARLALEKAIGKIERSISSYELDLVGAEAVKMITGMLRQPTSKNRILETILRTAADFLDVDSASLFLPDDNDDLVCAYGIGVSEAVRNARIVKGDNRPVRNVYEARAPIVLHTITEKYPSPSMMLPLSSDLPTDPRVLGVINLSNRGGSPDFTSQELRFAYLLREAASLVVSNNLLEDSIIEALDVAIDNKCSYTRGHSRRVSEYAGIIAEELGLSPEQVDEIVLGGYLHDIGKAKVPDLVLQKRGPLDPSEWVLMKQHPSIGGEILSSIPHLDRFTQIARLHHVYFDRNGRSYPDTDEEVPLSALVVGLADAFDAMTTNRPYRSACDMDYVRAELMDQRGKQFHPDCVGALYGALAKERIRLDH